MKVRYIPMQADPGDAERQRVQLTDLYKMGDTVAVWVNQGDILDLGEAVSEQQTAKQQFVRWLTNRVLRVGHAGSPVRSTTMQMSPSAAIDFVEALSAAGFEVVVTKPHV